jgi:integrase/recombinase XerD
VSTIREAAAEYLALRRATGYKYYAEGLLIGHFAGFLEERGMQHVTVGAALEWAAMPAGASPAWHAARLSAIRGLARHLAASDSRHQVPPPGLLPRRSDRVTPYLYSPQEIAGLVRAARAIAHPLRAAVFEHFVALMAVTGMRTGEAMALDRGDADLDAGVLTVRGAKFGKSRLVPLHPDVTARLGAYARRRDRLCPRPAVPAFFVSGTGTRLNHHNVSTTFSTLLAAAGISAPPGVPKPRPYDLRHSFAVATVARWYAEGRDVGHHLPALSTYMGHVSPASTHYYLHACPQLMTAAAQRLEEAWKEQAP